MKKIEIYVGTYAKYNNGSIAGEWLNLQDYDNIDDLYKAMAKIHSDEEDPEYMIQDICAPNIVTHLGLISECHIDQNIYDIFNSIECSHLSYDIIEAYIYCIGNEDNFQTLIDNAEEAYAGIYDSDEDFVHDLLEMCGDIPENMPSYIYIDWKKTAECIMQDYVTDNNYYFRYL